MRVEVVYALPLSQTVVAAELAPGATLRDAVESARMVSRHPEIQPGVTPAGIWGRPCPWDTPLQEGDRVEIYRPLLADPKDVRRQRAAKRR